VLAPLGAGADMIRDSRLYSMWCMAFGYGYLAESESGIRSIDFAARFNLPSLPSGL